MSSPESLRFPSSRGPESEHSAWAEQKPPTGDSPAERTEEPRIADRDVSPKSGHPGPGEAPLPRGSFRLDEEAEREIEAELARLQDEELLQKIFAGEDLSIPEEQERVLRGKVKARVVAVTEEDVFVDLGQRNQGVVPKASFGAVPQVGEELELLIERFDEEEGLYLLRVPGAAEFFDWETVRVGSVLDVHIVAFNAGGLEGTIRGVRVFVPASQVALERVEDLRAFVGQTLRCEVLEVRRGQRSLVASRRAVLERERAERRQQLLAELAEGQVRTGRVRVVREFGAFVDLGGIDGLVPVSEMSWSRAVKPEEILRPGDTVEVQVLRVDREQGKITLSLKQLQPSPWDLALQKYPAGSLVTGRVTRLAEYGAFVELEPGVEGLVHISELAPHHVRRVTEVVQIGDEVTVRVMSIQPEQRRISLSRRAALEHLARQEEQEAVRWYSETGSHPPKEASPEEATHGEAQKKKRKESPPRLKGGLDP
jgi:ribosomal protein S1